MAIRYDLEQRGHALSVCVCVFIFVYMCVCAYAREGDGTPSGQHTRAVPQLAWAGYTQVAAHHFPALAPLCLQCKVVAGAVVPPFPHSLDCDSLLCKEEKAHFLFWSFLYLCIQRHTPTYTSECTQPFIIQSRHF